MIFVVFFHLLRPHLQRRLYILSTIREIPTIWCLKNELTFSFLCGFQYPTRVIEANKNKHFGHLYVVRKIIEIAYNDEHDHYQAIRQTQIAQKALDEKYRNKIVNTTENVLSPILCHVIIQLCMLDEMYNELMRSDKTDLVLKTLSLSVSHLA